MTGTVKEWVDTDFFEREVSAPAPLDERTSIRDSSHVLAQGCMVEELTTVPAELMDFFK